MARALVTITCGELQVYVETDSPVYPDQLNDMCNRAANLFGNAVTQAKISGLNIMSPDGEFDDDETEDIDGFG